MKYKITLCSSSAFFDKLAQIQDILISRSHIIYFPHVWDWSNKTEDEIAKVQHDLIKRHFTNIENSDAIYIANFDKKEIKNYIGGNTFLEIGKAFDLNIPIFLMSEVPEMQYSEEIRAMKPHVIGFDWEKMEQIIALSNNKF